MSSNYDTTEFIDGDFVSQISHHTAALADAGHSQRAPSREEVDSRVAEAQQKLCDLKRAQEELERERASLEETRRRQLEFQTGRKEMLQNLTRGVGLLQEAEFNARREAEQMGKTLAGFREALARIEAIREETWKQDNFSTELTKALTTMENARMEWNAARLKFSVLTGTPPTGLPATPEATASASPRLDSMSFGQLCRMGLALTWPLVISALAIAGILAALLLRR